MSLGMKCGSDVKLKSIMREDPWPQHCDVMRMRIILGIKIPRGDKQEDLQASIKHRDVKPTCTVSSE